MRKWKWAAATVAGLGVLVFAALSVLMGGPHDAYGFLRYGATQIHKGNLKTGDRAPDVTVYSLDGKSTFHLRERIGARPLVLVFGSYT